PPAPIERGTFRFAPLDDQKDVPPRYRLDARSFPYEMERKRDLSAIGVTVYRLRFPSPVQSPTPENNTVHAEYYRPRGKGPFPAPYLPAPGQRPPPPPSSSWPCRPATRCCRATWPPPSPRTASPGCSFRWPTTARAGRPAARSACSRPTSATPWPPSPRPSST